MGSGVILWALKNVILMKRFLQVLFFLPVAFDCFSQASLPVTRTIWNAGAPTGWTDSGTSSYTSSFACTGNNMG